MKEDKNIYDLRKVFSADNNSKDEADKGNNDYNISVAN